MRVKCLSAGIPASLGRGTPCLHSMSIDAGDQWLSRWTGYDRNLQNAYRPVVVPSSPRSRVEVLSLRSEVLATPAYPQVFCFHALDWGLEQIFIDFRLNRRYDPRSPISFAFGSVIDPILFTRGPHTKLHPVSAAENQIVRVILRFYPL